MASIVEYDTNENENAKLSLTLLKEDGEPLTLSDVSTMVMTLIECATGEIVNGRDAQDVLNDNNCSLHVTSGLFTWDIQPEDTAIINSAVPIGLHEHHLMTLTITLAGGGGQRHLERLLRIKNRRKVPNA